MLALEVIEPVEQATEWCSGLTIAPKPNGSIRMCVDLTALNKGIRREVYPFPRISDVLSRLASGVMFSKLDANCGFWQVKLDPECKLYTTFITPWGRYCFRRMPFGISSAPEFYQRAMEKILKGLPGVEAYMDDLLIYGSSEAQHWSRLHDVLSAIQKSGVTLKREKCEFGCKSIKFLGRVISKAGISVDPAKVKAITEMLPPSTKKELRRFLGMVNYLGKFSKDLARLAEPLTAVSGKNAVWCWGVDQRDAFAKVKDELSTAPVLTVFDLNSEHRVSADASQSALGAVLLQKNQEGS